MAYNASTSSNAVERPRHSTYNKNLLYEFVEVIMEQRDHISSVLGEKKEERNENMLFLVSFVAKEVYGFKTLSEALEHQEEIFEDACLSKILLGKDKRVILLPSLERDVPLRDKETILWIVYENKDINKDVLAIYDHLLERGVSPRLIKEERQKIKDLITLRRGFYSVNA